MSGPPGLSRSQRPGRRDRRCHGTQCKAVPADEAGSGPRDLGGRFRALPDALLGLPAGPAGECQARNKHLSAAEIRKKGYGWGRDAAAEPAAGLKNDQQEGSTKACGMRMVNWFPIGIQEWCKDTRALHYASLQWRENELALAGTGNTWAQKLPWPA